MLHANALVFGWDRPIPGREHVSAQHFEEMVGYLTGLQSDGTISAWEPIFITGGGSFNGMFLLRGDRDKLDGVLGSETWAKQIMKAEQHLLGVRVAWAIQGDGVPKAMQVWGEAVQKFAK